MVTPWMHKSEIQLIERFLKPNMTVLEWGSGGSTLHFSKLVKKYYSVEHNKQWFDKIKVLKPNNVTYCYVPANREVSRKYSTFDDYRDYITVIDKFNEKFDFVLIDGRARVSCAKYVKKYLNDGGLVAIHDFYKKNRQRYHVVLQEFDEVASITDTIQGLTILKPKI